MMYSFVHHQYIIIWPFFFFSICFSKLIMVLMIRNPHKREHNKNIRVENNKETFNVHFYKKLFFLLFVFLCTDKKKKPYFLFINFSPNFIDLLIQHKHVPVILNMNVCKHLFYHLMKKETFHYQQLNINVWSFFFYFNIHINFLNYFSRFSFSWYYWFSR
jgi:hypothetical protein